MKIKENQLRNGKQAGIGSIFVVSAVLLAIFAIPALGAPNITASVSSLTVAKGDTGSVKLLLNQNGVGISIYQVSLSYDKNIVKVVSREGEGPFSDDSMNFFSIINTNGQFAAGGTITSNGASTILDPSKIVELSIKGNNTGQTIITVSGIQMWGLGTFDLVSPQPTRYLASNVSIAVNVDKSYKTYNFAVAKFINQSTKPDVFAIKKKNTGFNKTEVHILNGTNNYGSFFSNTVTVLSEAGENVSYDINDWNSDGKPDLFVVNRKGASGWTEVSILNGADNFQSYLLKDAVTALGPVGSNVEFAIAKYDGDSKPDLYIIIKSVTGSGMVEVHVLSGMNNFQQFLLHIATPIASAGDNFEFSITHDNTIKPNIFAIKKSATGTLTTEVWVLNGAANYQNYLLQTGTILPETDNNFEFKVGDWNNDGKIDVFAVKKSATGSGSTEVHILNGATNYQNYLINLPTILPETN